MAYKRNRNEIDRIKQREQNNKNLQNQMTLKVLKN